MFIKNVQRYADVVCSLTHLVEGLSPETLVTVKEEKSVIFLAGIRIPTESVIEQQLILFLKKINKK
jgi:hypothetical protein